MLTAKDVRKLQGSKSVVAKTLRQVESAVKRQASLGFANATVDVTSLELAEDFKDVLELRGFKVDVCGGSKYTYLDVNW